MDSVSTIGLDIAKNVFQVQGGRFPSESCPNCLLFGALVAGSHDCSQERWLSRIARIFLRYCE